MTDRLAALRRNFDEWQVDGVLITGAANRRWLTGFTGSYGRVLVTRDRAILLTDSRYWEQAQRQAPGFELFRYKDEKDDTLNFLKLGGATKLGLESRNMTVGEHSALVALDGFVWMPLATTLESLRAIKTAEELACIRAAARLTDDTVAHFPRLARPGVTERALAWELEKYMREHGADRVGFEIIVAAGPNSALPHHRPGDRPLAAGDIIVVDLGAEVGGYKSDLTRSFYLGDEPESDFWVIYDTVNHAHQAAITGIRPGVTGKAVDALARDVITAAGHGDHFGHGTGHGVGLDIHEEPRFSRLAKETIIPAGAVMTVEPGIYVPGYGGVRIEDLILVTDSGAEYLSAAPKTPLIPVEK